jgi:hypothetical protein
MWFMQVEPLIKVKEHLKGVDRRKAELDLRIDANKAALQVRPAISIARTPLGLAQASSPDGGSCEC